MKTRIFAGLFWAGMLLCALAGVNVWPARTGAGLRAAAEASAEPGHGTDGVDWPDAARVVAYGCKKFYPMQSGAEIGYRVIVWADYERQEKPLRSTAPETVVEPPGTGLDRPPTEEKPRSKDAHDWEKWLSFRRVQKGNVQSEKKADAASDEDCREWRRTVAKQIEKARRESGKQTRKEGP